MAITEDNAFELPKLRSSFALEVSARVCALYFESHRLTNPKERHGVSGEWQRRWYNPLLFSPSYQYLFSLLTQGAIFLIYRILRCQVLPLSAIGCSPCLCSDQQKACKSPLCQYLIWGQALTRIQVVICTLSQTADTNPCEVLSVIRDDDVGIAPCTVLSKELLTLSRKRLPHAVVPGQKILQQELHTSALVESMPKSRSMMLWTENYTG